MDAAAETAFDELAHATGRKLWPGRVNLAGEEYDCVITREMVSVTFDQTGGVSTMQGCRVDIDKEALPVQPESQITLTDLADGKNYLIKEVGGTAPTDTSWTLTGILAV